jgi:hypothetical protein
MEDDDSAKSVEEEDLSDSSASKEPEKKETSLFPEDKKSPVMSFISSDMSSNESPDLFVL